MPDYSYIGSGRAYLREIGGGGGLIEVGNASNLTFSVTEETIEQRDFTQPGGGTYNEVRRISAVECTITMAELSPANLARAVYGSATAVASTTVSGEAVTVYPDAFSAFAHLPLTTPTPTVVPAQASATARANTTAYALNSYVLPATPNGFYYKATTAGTSAGTIPTFPTTIGATVTDGTVTWTCAGRTTLVAGTDYEIRPGGIFVYVGRLIAGEVLTCGYTRAAADVVQALTNSGKEYELVFDGLNEARSGKRTRVTAYRVKVGAAQQIALIGEEYAALEVTGKLLKDTSKTGAGVSQYFAAVIEQ
jgi:hypothetical protein